MGVAPESACGCRTIVRGDDGITHRVTNGVPAAAHALRQLVIALDIPTHRAPRRHHHTLFAAAAARLEPPRGRLAPTPRPR